MESAWGVTLTVLRWGWRILSEIAWLHSWTQYRRDTFTPGVSEPQRSRRAKRFRRLLDAVTEINFWTAVAFLCALLVLLVVGVYTQ